MFNIQKIYKFLVIILSLLIISTGSKVVASELYSDPFLNGIKPFWEIYSGADPPSISNFGITGSSILDHWSIIALKISDNSDYEINFDLKVNNDNSPQTWGIGIGDDTINWKIINTLDSSLQLHDSTGNTILTAWDHSKGIHKFRILISPFKNTSISIYEDGSLLNKLQTSLGFNMNMFWLSIKGNGDYEFANFKLCDAEGCASAPPPSTPKKVVVIPGMGGSWNKDAFLKCKLDGYDGSWTPWLVNGTSPYQSLVDSLKTEGFEPTPFYYDWRKPIAQNALLLKQVIDATSAGERVDIVGHSMGGLVGRKYLETEQLSNKLEKFLTVGSPHQGSVFAYPAWSGGEMWIDDKQIKLAATLLQVGCFITHGWTAQQMYTHLIPSFQSVLPTFDYLQDNSENYIPVGRMFAQNNWLPSSLSPPFYGVTVGSISGTGYETLRSIPVRPPNKQAQRTGIWADGKPTGSKKYADGDGTVLTQSSLLPGAQSITLALDHLSLVTNQTGILNIINFLKGTISPESGMKIKQQFYQKSSGPISALLIVVDGAHAILRNPTQVSYEDSDGQITLLDPEEGLYTLAVTPDSQDKSSSCKIIVIQLFENGDTKWKTYEKKDSKPKKYKIRLNAKDRKDDILTSD